MTGEVRAYRGVAGRAVVEQGAGGGRVGRVTAI